MSVKATEEVSRLEAKWAALVQQEEGRFGRKAWDLSGFIEGYSGAAPPHWWSRNLQAIDVGTTQECFFSWRRLKKQVRNWSVADGYTFNGFDRIQVRDNSLELTRCGRTVTVLPAVFPKTRGLTRPLDYSIAGTMIKDRCLFVPDCGPGILGLGRKIYCVDLSGTEIWNSALETGLPPGGFSGEYYGSYVEIAVVDSIVSVWTVHDFGLTFETFALDDGQRFHSLTIRFQLE